MVQLNLIAERRSNKTGQVVAECKLNTPLVTVDEPAFIAVDKILIKPNFYVLNGLSVYVESSDGKSGEVVFDDIYEISYHNVIKQLDTQLTKEFGTRDPLLKMTKQTDGKFVLKLRKSSSAKFSPALAELLQINEIQQNTHATSQANILFKINLPQQVNALDSCTYLLKCGDIMQNTILNNKMDCIMGVLHLPGGQAVMEWVSQDKKYYQLRPGRYSSLTFALYTLDNTPVISFNSVSFIVSLNLIFSHENRV